jgi:glycosyltransferase involved in cell wall biosynthesis
VKSSKSRRRASLLQRLITSAKSDYDYPKANLGGLTRSFDSAMVAIAKLGEKLHDIRQLSASEESGLAELEWRVSGEGGHAYRHDLHEPLELLSARIETLEEMRRQTDRTLHKLHRIRTETWALFARPMAGLKTQKSKLLNTRDRIIQTLDYTHRQIKRLENLNKVADSIETLALCRQQLNAGFQSLAMKELLAAAYAPTSQLVSRRVALAILSRWAYARELAPWSEIFENHYALARNAFAQIHNRQLKPVTKLKANEYIVPGAFEAMLELAGKPDADRELILRLSNMVGRIEQVLQLDSRYRHMVQLSWVNFALAKFSLEPISYRSGDKDRFDLLECDVPLSANIDDGPLVSIILPAYNSASWLPTALDSLLNQTWKNLEVLVVDDQSTDGTYEVAKAYANQDSRVRVLQNQVNAGPYVARNLALDHARGLFVTVHDADDWSHPRKIERQARNLLDNPELIANTSQMARMNPTNVQLLSSANQITRLNYSSLMFRRVEVTKTMGFWDPVRFGADSEFIARLELAFGSTAVAHLESGLLSMVRSIETSLTAGGLADKLKGARKLYKRLYLDWHQQCEASPAELYLDANGPRKFVAPRKSLGFEQPTENYPLVLVDDLSDSSNSNLANLLATRGALTSGCAYVHVSNPMSPATSESRTLKDRSIKQELTNLRLIWDEYGVKLKLKSNRTVVSASALVEKYSMMTPFSSSTIEIVFQTLEQVHEVRQVFKNCVTTLGAQPTTLLALDDRILKALAPQKEAGWDVRLL